jgi:hypothetical protein
MRLWSLNPKYLDSKGLLACWREGLLAKKVLEGKTKGYKNHSQLIRFKKLKNPCSAINSYLLEIEKEAKSRGYNFNKSKIGKERFKGKIPVTKGQLLYEFEHLKNKLKTRNPKLFLELKKIQTPAPHPLFKIVFGEIEDWEKVFDSK